mgnify:CR=1 FL=1
MRFFITLTLSLGLCLVAMAATAADGSPWTLDNARSQLSFVSVKAGDFAEVHTFERLSGAVGADGGVEVVIDLASVNTLIPIRDERMREVLFETLRFPTASLVGRVEMDSLQALGPGEVTRLDMEGQLLIKDHSLVVTLDLLAARLADDAVLVSSLKPVIVDAAGVGLVDGVEQLREIAGLPSISKAVPVSFVLVFRKDG